MRVKQVNYRGVNLTIVVKRVKGKLYVYDEFRDKATGKVKTYYIGPLEEMVRVYQIVKQGNYVKLTRRELTTLARKIVEYYVKKHAVVNSTRKHHLNMCSVAGPRGLEPRTTGSAGRRPILAGRRALEIIHVRGV